MHILLHDVVCIQDSKIDLLDSPEDVKRKIKKVYTAHLVIIFNMYTHTHAYM